MIRNGGGVLGLGFIKLNNSSFMFMIQIEISFTTVKLAPATRAPQQQVQW